MADIPKFKNASEITAYLEELYKDANMMEDDKKILSYELRGIEHKERMADTEFKAKWDEKHKLSREKMKANPQWKKSHKLRVQKAFNKQISCDGVIYESGKAAALALAPETRLTHDSRGKWLRYQMKKFPERYFYVTKSE